MSSAQIIQQADELKASVADTSSGSNEAWVARQALQDLYQKLLVMDLEFALDKKVEQDLWNHAFKNQITVLQNQAKDKQNPKRSEIQASLNLFLETASGFYLQLLQELCSAFKLDLTFRRKSSHFGIFKARYRQQIEQAQSYYRHAAHLVPYNGQPYNQLAILEAAKSNKLSTVYYYTRSIAVKHPFPVASTNLDKFYTKISKETLDYRGKLSMSETISTFLQFHAFVHLDSAPDKARKHGERLIVSLPTHITSMSFSSYQLVQMVAINLFALHRSRKKQVMKDTNDNAESAGLGEGSRTYGIVLNLTVTMLEQLVYNTPKQEQKAKDYHTLPALKVLLDWLHTDSALLKQEAFRNSGTWPHMSKLLNNLQFHGGHKDQIFDADRYTSTPLPEDCDLQCFLPMVKAHAHLDFSKANSDFISGDVEIRLRCLQLVQHGKWIADELASLGLLAYTRLKTGRLQFSAPSGPIKILSGAEGDIQAERKHVRQNVAIQAIMQKQQQNEGVAKIQDPNEPEIIKQRPSVEPQHQPQIQQQYKQPPQQVQQQQQYKPFTQPYNQFQPLAYQPTNPGVPGVGMVGDGPLPNPQVGHQMVQQNNILESHSPRSRTPIGVHPHGQIGAHPGYTPPMGTQLSPQARPAGMIPMGHPGQGLTGYGNANGNMQGMDGGGQGQKSFQQAPGSVRLPAGPTSASVQGSQFTGHKTPPPMRSHQQSILTQSPSSGRPILSGQYSHSTAYNQGYQPSSPYSNNTNVGMVNSNTGFSGNAVGGMSSHQQQMSNLSYGSSFPQAQAPSPQPLPNPSTNPLLSLLSGANLNPDYPLSQAMLALVTSDSSMPSNLSGISQNAGNLSYSQLATDDGGGMHYGYSNVGRIGLNDDGNQNMMLPREAFNKEEPELKFADINLDAKSYSSSPGLNFSGLSIGDQVRDPGISNQDSPNAQSGLSSLFPFSNESGLSGMQTDNTYSLFSKSPWTVPLPKSESNKSLSSSPFGSGEDSLRNTPDPFGDMGDARTLSSGFPLGYTFGSSDGNWANPPSPIPTDENSSTKTLLSSSIQSLWSSGPSPLEKLLEQQKQQRHGDPL